MHRKQTLPSLSWAIDGAWFPLAGAQLVPLDGIDLTRDDAHRLGLALDAATQTGQLATFTACGGRVLVAPLDHPLANEVPIDTLTVRHCIVAALVLPGDDPEAVTR